MFPKLLAFTLSVNILHCHPLGSCLSKHKGYSVIKIHCTFLTSVIPLTPMDSPVYCRCTAHFSHCRQLVLHRVSSLGAPGQGEGSWQGTPFLLLVQELMISLGLPPPDLPGPSCLQGLETAIKQSSGDVLVLQASFCHGGKPP